MNDALRRDGLAGAEGVFLEERGVETERARIFRIAEIPGRLFGQAAVVHTSYQYETNTLWRRNEIMMLSVVDEDTLNGELVSEYVLDGVPVAKAIYRITCHRQ